MENILSSINKSSLKFLEPMSLRQTVSLIVEEASKLLRADYCALYLKKNNSLNRVSTYPFRNSEAIVPRRRGFTYRAYRERKAFVLQAKDIVRIHPELVDIYRSALCIPLSYQNKSIGSLLLVSRDDKKFSKKDLNLLKIFGSYASLAIRKAILLEDVNKALETRDLFISLAAHEFRTPLTTINGYTQLLEKKLSSTDSQELKWVKNLRGETVRLNYLINELLQVDRVKRGNFSYSWSEHEFASIIEKVLANFRVVYPKRKIEFHNLINGGSHNIVCDKEKLYHALYNLFDNAAKFSKESETIDVELKIFHQKFKLLIQDRGRGIDSKDILKIFEGFYRKESDVAYGMGVGLFLTKNIIKMHKGTIEIHSKINHGTTVEVNLPQVKETNLSL